MKKIIIILGCLLFINVQAVEKVTNKFYIGLGISDIDGSSANNTFDSLVTSIFTFGVKVNSVFTMELSTTIFSTKDNGYELQNARSASIITAVSMGKYFSLLGKLGSTRIKLTNASGGLRATDVSYGVGLRYNYDEQAFVDAVYEQITDKTINNRDEDIRQTTIVLKQTF